MKHLFVFKEHNELEYGLFKVVRETKTRYYFEHVAGSKLAWNFGVRDESEPTPGRVFNYHKTYWLTKSDAVNRRIGLVADELSFRALVESHKYLVKTINHIRDKAEKEVTRARSRYENGVANIKIENEDDDDAIYS